MSATTNSTASNLVGAGRGIGKLYSRGGRILERAISDIAHKLGFGPYAVSQRIISLITMVAHISLTEVLLESEPNAIVDGFDRLWKYIECVSVTL
jgi:hypothetical protein